MATNVMIRPVGDRLVVRRDDVSDVTPGGIVLPNNATEKPSRGKVVAVGPGKLREDGGRCDMDVADGDTVIFNNYSGTEVELDGETYLVLRESDVLFVA